MRKYLPLEEFVNPNYLLVSLQEIADILNDSNFTLEKRNLYILLTRMSLFANKLASNTPDRSQSYNQIVMFLTKTNDIKNFFTNKKINPGRIVDLITFNQENFVSATNNKQEFVPQYSWNAQENELLNKKFNAIEQAAHLPLR